MNRQQEVYNELARRDKAAAFFLKTPAETSQRFVKYAKWTNESEKLDYGCVLDTVLTPPMPGDYISIMARPGHKKTAFGVGLAKRYARRIIDTGRMNEEVVVYATWDEAVENIEGYLHAGLSDFNVSDIAWGRVTEEQAIRAGIQRVNAMSPLWVWGVSIMDNDKKKPVFTADWLFDTVQALRYEFKLNVKALFLDYLQKIPVFDERNRTEEVTKASNSAKMLGKEIGTPVFAMIQASREADKQSDMIPGWSHAQHASAIEQDSTKQLALSNPIKYLDEGDTYQLGDKIDTAKYYTVDDALTIIRILKQRGERGAGTFAVSIDPKTLEIADAPELERSAVRLDS
jgi:replicative DNA helicase